VNIHIRYFAAFREAAGIDSESVVTEAISPADLFSECAVRHTGLQNYSSSLVAINDEMVSWDSALSENDRVLFFPPVAGG
jgi:molybdopterin converting factor small subunit